MPDAKTIGLTLAERATIKQVMEDKNMTYQALAEPLGMNCKVLSLVLDGKTNAKYTLLERLYGAFGEARLWSLCDPQTGKWVEFLGLGPRRSVGCGLAGQTGACCRA